MCWGARGCNSLGVKSHGAGSLTDNPEASHIGRIRIYNNTHVSEVDIAHTTVTGKRDRVSTRCAFRDHEATAHLRINRARGASDSN